MFFVVPGSGCNFWTAEDKERRPNEHPIVRVVPQQMR